MLDSDAALRPGAAFLERPSSQVFGAVVPMEMGEHLKGSRVGTPGPPTEHRSMKNQSRKCEMNLFFGHRLADGRTATGAVSGVNAA